MPGIVLLLLVASMVAGIGLLWAGLRGKRLNNHPVCGWCKFDLEGVYPDGVTCPECGAGLKREGAVRMGVRRRMPGVIALGVLLAAVPVAPIATVTYALLTGSNIDSYKPLGLLLWESKHSDAARLDAIATELANRAMAKKLSPAQYASVVDSVLDFQGDTSRPWAESWGDLIERAKLDGALTAEQEQRFHAQAAVLELEVRPTVQAGSTTPARIKLKEARVGSGMAMECSVKVTGATVDGRPAKWRTRSGARPDPFFGRPLGENDQVASFILQGKSGRGGRMLFFGGGPSTGEVQIEVPDHTALGDRPVELDLELGVGEGQSGGIRTFALVNGTLRSSNPSSSTSQVPARASREVTIVGPQDPVVTPIDADAQSTQSIAAAMKPSQLTLGGDMLGGFVITRNGIDRTSSDGDASVQFDLGGVQTPIAYDVYCRADGHEWKLGELHSGSQADRGNGGVSFQMSSTVIVNGKVVQQSSSSAKDGREVSGPWEGGDADTVDIVLKPSSDVAARTMDLDRYYAGSIVFERVPVVRMPGSDIDRQFDEMDRALRQQLTPFSRPPLRQRPSTRPSPDADGTEAPKSGPL